MGSCAYVNQCLTGKRVFSPVVEISPWREKNSALFFAELSLYSIPSYEGTMRPVKKLYRVLKLEQLSLFPCFTVNPRTVSGMNFESSPPA